jgi:hypothetical protein
MLRDLGTMQLKNRMDKVYNTKNKEKVNSFFTGSGIMYSGMWLRTIVWAI